MFDHLGLHVKDLARSIAFYQAALAPLGAFLLDPDGNNVEAVCMEEK